MSLVLDSSMCLAWCFEDERGPRVLAIIDRVIEEGAIVPGLWRYEIANGLLMAQRRQRLDAGRRSDLLAALDAFGIARDHEPEGDPWNATVRLAELYGLTVVRCVLSRAGTAAATASGNPRYSAAARSRSRRCRGPRLMAVARASSSRP